MHSQPVRKVGADASYEEVSDSRASPAWLGFGFFFFGAALGEVTGFSIAQGISQTLLSALFTFVGGALLTFAGFRVSARGSAGRVVVDSVRTGVGLGCFSLGVLLGVNLGVISRCNRYFEHLFLGEDVAHSMCVNGPGPSVVGFGTTPNGSTAAGPPTGVGVQAAEATECQKRRGDMDTHLGVCPQPEQMRDEFSQYVARCAKP
jgi:hypothetical protein